MISLKSKVLVVDDMPTMRKLVIMTCKKIGFTEFVEAEDGAKAWEAVNGSSLPFGLVISDWNMPNCTGLDFLKRVRADSRFQQLPFILLTAEAEKEQIMQAIAAKVDSYIVKPFTGDKLIEKVEKLRAKAA